MNKPRLHYFDEHEFVRGGVNWFPMMDTRLLVLLDTLRHVVQRPFLVSESKHALGRREGDDPSMHNVEKHGWCFAVDGFFDGVRSVEQATDVVALATDIGITGIGVYTDWRQAPYGWHFDTRPDANPGYPETWGRVAPDTYVSLKAALEGIA